MQQIKIEAGRLKSLGIEKPAEMPDEQEVSLDGGMTLIFDEYGQLKFAVAKRLLDLRDPRVQARQSRRLADLWRFRYYRKGASLARRFSTMHRQRALATMRTPDEEW